MVAPPSLESIKAAYQDKQPSRIRVTANGIVKIEASDGDASLLPSADDLPPPEESTIDALLDTGEIHQMFKEKWLEKIGNYLIHEGRGEWHHQPEHRTYRLKRFPDGYKLYVHLKGNKRNPRRDAYLYGSTRVKVFRSPEEFVLHCKWLAFGKPVDDKNRPLCLCAYCSGREQKEIHERLKDVVEHLNTYSSTSDTRPRGGQRREKSKSPDGPVMAKDYTHLNQGEGVSTWVQGHS